MNMKDFIKLSRLNKHNFGGSRTYCYNTVSYNSTNFNSYLYILFVISNEHLFPRDP